MRGELRAAARAGSADGVAEAAEELLGQLPAGMSGDEREELVAEAAGRELDARLDDPQTRAIVLRHARSLSGNPRELKRFVNVFRFYAHIDLTRRLNGLPGVGVEGAAKLARVAVGWPSFTGALTGAPAPGEASLLTRLEQVADDEAWERLVEGAPERVRPALSSTGELRAVIAAEPKVGALAGSFV
jgi:hypothetical protein